MAQIIVGDVLEEFEVCNTSGERIGVVKFNPADPEIVDRYSKIADDMGKISQKDGETEAEFAKRAAQEIKDLIDYVLGQKCSDVFFSVASPLNVMYDGSLYCESVLAGIATAIENTTGARIKRVTTKVNKYAKKYHK